MNKRIFFCLLFLSVLAPGLAAGGMRPIHVELSYSGSAVKYILYQDGVQSCVSTDPGALQMDCTVEIAAIPMTFTLTAVDAAGIESPQSAPYTLVPPAIDPVTGNYIPQAKFTATATTGVAPLPVSFDASASWDLGGMIVSYEWDFGDGGIGAGTLIDHVFISPGTYTVTLTVVDDEGATAEKTAAISVSAPIPAPNKPPIAVIGATPLQPGTSQIRFDASASSDPEGSIASYAWNFGDGDSAVGTQVDHEFLAIGDYTVMLTVTDDQGASSQDQIIMSIVDPPTPANTLPAAFISASTQQRLVHFEWDYTGTDPGLAGFRFYQNGRLVCEVADPTARQGDCLTFIDNGTVRLAITSYDQAGTESAASGLLTFDSTGLYPEAGGDAPLAVHFSPGASADPDGTITSYAWDFGDGEIATSMEADHLFTVPGNYLVTLTVTDNSGGKAQATTIVKVTDGHPPAAFGASFSTDQDKSVTATLSASDPEGSPLTFRVTKAASLGMATITDAAKGVFTYVPKLGFSGADSFSFKVNDGTFDSNEAVVSIAVQKSNSAPTATDQTLAVLESGTASGTLSATDADSDPLTFSLVGLPTHGTATIGNAGTGAFTYTPTANFTGSDSFTFKVNDGRLDSGLATVTVTIAPTNILPVAFISASSQQRQRLVHFEWDYTGTDSELAGFRFYQNGRLVCEIADPTARQTDCLTSIDDGTVQFAITSFDQAGTESETSSALTFDNAGLYQEAGGDAPLAVHFTPGASTDPDGTIASYAWDFGDGETATSMAADHSFPLPGNYTVILTVTDNSGGQAQAMTVIKVTDGQPPLAINSSLTTDQDKAVTGTLSASDPEGSPLTFMVTKAASLGMATITDAAKGVFTYVPKPGVYGADSFSFKANDGTFDSNEAVVSISIRKINSAPMATDQTLPVMEDKTANGTLTATDADSDPMTFSLVTSPIHGTATIVDSATGAFIYTPSANATGSDSFTFKVSDGTLDSGLATVSVAIAPVNDAPTAAALSLSATEDLVASGKLSGADLDGEALTYSIVTNGAKGKAVITDATTGAFTYAPSANSNGSDSFTFTVNDGTLDSGLATVSVAIAPVNDAPTATGLSLWATEDMVAAGRLPGSDLDGDPLTFSIITNGTKGKAVVTDATTGAFTYTPSANSNGQDSFVYRVSDGVWLAEATVTVAIAPANDAPTAANLSLSATEDLVASGKLSGADLDGNALTYSIVTNGAKGKAVITDAATGAFTYTPSANRNGQDSFVYRVSDGQLSAEATVTVTIAPVNDAPKANPDYAQVKRGGSVLIPVRANDSDVDGNPLTLVSVSIPLLGKATITNGAVTYTANKIFIGKVTFSYKISDGKGGTATGTVTVTAVQ